MERMTRRERKVCQARARRNKDVLTKVTQLAAVLFKGEKEEVEAWIYSPNKEFDGDSPLEKILSGEGTQVERYLKNKIASMDTV